MGTLQVERRTDDGDRVLLHLRGELDAHHGQVVHDALAQVAEEGRRDVTVDVSEVSFLDSSGLRVLLEAEERVRAEGGVLRLREPSPQVTHILELTDLAGRFDLD